MNSFPKNLSKIVSPAAFRDYCLNPKGIKITPTSHFEKARPVDSFLNYNLTLWRVGKELKKNQIVFRCNPKLTKPEIKQYLQKIYKLEIEKIGTANYMGKIKAGPLRRRYRAPDFKKVYVDLRTEVDELFQKIDTK